jgi:cellulose synthase/poly-beta-1,6-N-acetylglucosamine synthase-like glycosyltransferase
MRWLFWGATIWIVYTYAGYAAWLWGKARLWPQPIERAAIEPSVSIVMVVRDEQETVREKMNNLLALDYPREKLQIVVVSDGSTDRTLAILQEFGDPRITVLQKPAPQGKASGLNDALGAANGDIVVFVDARQRIEKRALRFLVENFADTSVGCVSGELMLGDRDGGESGAGVGLYWKIEKKIREWESASGSVMGATGALYAVRRELVGRIPDGTVLDDVYVPMRVVRQSGRVVWDARARAWDHADFGTGREFSRKVRTLGGNYQLVRMEPWLLGPGNPAWFSFVSHKLMRLGVPLALIGLLVSSVLTHGPLYRVALWLQVAFYGLSGLAWMGLSKAGRLGRAADAARTFVVLNAAALVALTVFVSGRRVEWTR